MTQEDENQEQEDRDTAIIKSHVAQLSEHFETVQIFCTRHMPAELDGTVCVQWGAGNWYARYGGIKEWVFKREEEFRVQVRPAED